MQSKCIRYASTRKNDIIACLPTGYGKSLIYEILPTIESLLFQQVNGIIVVVTPLNASINEQVRKLGNEAVEINRAFPTSDAYSQYAFKFLFGHPEAFLDKSLHHCLASISERVRWIVVDEAHCILQWGENFRPSYGMLYHLRAMFSNARLLALTATCTQRARRDIEENLFLENPVTVTASADRRNIYLSAQKRAATVGGANTAEEAYVSILTPLLEELLTSTTNFPKTIIYAKLKWCGFGYNFFHRELNEAREGGYDVHIEMVSQYHAPCKEETRRDTLAKFSARDSAIKLMFATEALGMGVDIPDIHRIIHFEPPYTLESFMQQIGRAGRVGRDASSLLLYNASDISTALRDMHDDVRHYCTLSTCRRKFLAQYFGYESEDVDPKRCCDICSVVVVYVL